MKELMTDKEKNGVYGIQVFLEKFYYDDEDDDGSMDESSDTYKLLVEQLNRMKQKVRGLFQYVCCNCFQHVNLRISSFIKI